jgi:AcrR family transcriptional regulator
MARRSYPKGLAKREEILAIALKVIAEHGFSGATLRELADASNLSITGLVHHFGTKEQLLTEVLRRRDELDVDTYEADPPESASAMIERLNRLVAHNAGVPGLVSLYSNLAADATASDHPAHEYFRERYERSQEIGQNALGRLKDLGELPGDVDPTELALLITAAVDGLQLLWQYDNRIDMTRVLDTLRVLLEGLRTRDPQID